MLPVLFEVSNSEDLPTLHMVFFLRLLLERLEPVLPLVFLRQKRLQRFQRFRRESVNPPNKVRLVSSPVVYTVGEKEIRLDIIVFGVVWGGHCAKVECERAPEDCWWGVGWG